MWRGVGPISGAILSDGGVEVDAETGQAAATLVTENITKMWSRLLPGRYSNAMWVANESTKPALCELSVTAGTGGGPVGFVSGDRGAALQPPTTLLGRPIFFNEMLPGLGTSGDIVLLDPTLYVFGGRTEILVEASPHERFSYDEVVFRAKVRCCGTPALRDTVTGKDSVERGWLVKLATRS